MVEHSFIMIEKFTITLKERLMAYNLPGIVYIAKALNIIKNMVYRFKIIPFVKFSSSGN